MIEKGRYSRSYKPPEERLCPFCQSKKEDDKHFLLYCDIYGTFEGIVISGIEQQSMETKFRLLIDPPAKLAATISKYIYNCFEKREKALSPT